MKVIFAGGNGYTPEFSGGVQSSTHHLAEQLIEHGHEASVLAALFGDGFFGFRARAKMKLLRQPAVIDSFPGYPVVRAWFPWEAARFAVEKMKPDVAVVHSCFHIYGDVDEKERNSVGLRVVRKVDGRWRTVAVQNTDVRAGRRH